MKHQVLFGIKSTSEDEKTIHNKLKEFLALIDRKTSTAKNPTMLESFLPFRIKHYHWNLNKKTGIFIKLFPNVDLDENIFAPSKPECSWLLSIIFHQDFPGYEKVKSEDYIISLLDSLNYEYEMIYETDSRDSIKYGDIK